MLAVEWPETCQRHSLLNVLLDFVVVVAVVDVAVRSAFPQFIFSAIQLRRSTSKTDLPPPP